MKFRHNGPGIALVMFVLILIINFIKQRKIKISSILIVTFIVMYIIASIPEKIVLNNNVSKNSAEKSIYSIFNGTILHAMGAILNSDIEMEEDEYCHKSHR